MTVNRSQIVEKHRESIQGIDAVRTGKQIRKYMNLRGVSVEDVKEYLSLGCVQSVYHWLHGKSLPSLDNLYVLSRYLRVPMDALIVGIADNNIIREDKKAVEDDGTQRLLYYYQWLQRNIAA